MALGGTRPLLGESVSNVLVGFGTLPTEQKLSKTWVWAALGWPTWFQFGSLNPPKSHLGGVLGRLAGVLRRLGCVLGRLGASWSRPGRILGRLRGVLGGSWRSFGASYGILGRLGALWGRLGPDFRSKMKPDRSIPSWMSFLS